MSNKFVDNVDSNSVNFLELIESEFPQFLEFLCDSNYVQVDLYPHQSKNLLERFSLCKSVIEYNGDLSVNGFDFKENIKSLLSVDPREYVDVKDWIKQNIESQMNIINSQRATLNNKKVERPDKIQKIDAMLNELNVPEGRLHDISASVLNLVENVISRKAA